MGGFGRFERAWQVMMVRKRKRQYRQVESMIFFLLSVQSPIGKCNTSVGENGGVGGCGIWTEARCVKRSEREKKNKRIKLMYCLVAEQGLHDR
jgi:hypothetical protein